MGPEYPVMEYTAEFTPSGSGKVDTTINIAKDSFTRKWGSIQLDNTAATEFNWTYDPIDSKGISLIFLKLPILGNVTMNLKQQMFRY